MSIPYGPGYGFDDLSAQAWLGVYTLFAVLGTRLFPMLQTVVSVAIILWFCKNRGGSAFSTLIAPAISFVVQLWLVYTWIDNLKTLGGTNRFATSIPYIGLGIMVVGLVWSFVLKSVNPTGYANIGHMANDEA